jgi:uncharacterized membrane protein
MAETNTAAGTATTHPGAAAAGAAAKKPSGRERFPFVDQFRGLVGVMMALGHSSGFFNSAWKTLSMFDPFFSSHGQFWLRYMGYLCAPGFLMMNGTVAWYSYTRRIAAGHSAWAGKWHLIQRGLFLVLVQITWVNMAWVGFRLEKYRVDHIGIIATIGISMVLLALIVDTKWYVRLFVALAVWIGHQLLLAVPYDPAVLSQKILFETFIQAGDWNKYPVLPWFGLGVMGSVMATGWLEAWKTPRRRIAWSFGIGIAALLVASAIRLGRGFGNIEIFDQFPHYSFFLERKYPPSLFHNVWFFGAVSLTMGVVQVISVVFPPLVRWLGTIGKVPLFFYCMHITILSIVADRLGVYYRQGAVAASLVGWVPLLLVMWPLARWFGGVKARSKNRIIQMI